MNFHNYELVEKVYQDSRSQISRAVYKPDGSKVLIKTINSIQADAKDGLRAELAILNRLDSKNIIKVDRAKTQIDQFLVLEDFPGQSLVKFLQEQSISVPTFLTLAIELVLALKEIHRQGIIHCNIQPSCILINLDLELKIVDFAAATNTKTNGQLSSMRLKEQSRGHLLPLESLQKAKEQVPLEKRSELNIAYIAPEQTGRAKVVLDCRTDFYALGILLYRLITGVLPYNAQNSLELIHSHLAQIPLPPNLLDESIPSVISSIIIKLLAKNPDDRYQTAGALEADLKECQTQYLKRGRIEPFELGVLDSCSEFAISNQLYGRSQGFAEIAKSISFSSPAPRMLLLSGASGLGKTALVKQAVPTIINHKDYFITGSFEPQSTTPYKAIIQALKELIQGILKKTSDSRRLWQQKIKQAIAEHEKVITNILPELELIIGSQPDLPPVSVPDSQHRFSSVLVKFLQVFTTEPESRLILFLDNLQWADSASLDSIELLLSNKENQNLVIIGAYRDEAIAQEHPLTKTIARLAPTVEINRIALQPLNSSQINRLLVDTFYCDSKRSIGLAQLLLGRTHGNPFFVTQLLQSFYQEQLISFDYHTFSWQWSIDKIYTTSITNYDVLELVCQNFRQLAPLCQQILKLAACIGQQFNLIQLRQIWNEQLHLDHEEIAEILDDALEAGIIIFEHQASTPNYQFLHHRIHQAIYSSIEQAELSQLHLIIGQSLLHSIRENELRIFELVHHFNLARIGAKGSLDTNYLVELNLTASQKAQAANAYEVAANYSTVALELLPPSAWQNDYDLMLASHQAAIKIQYLQRNFIHVEQLCNIVLTQAETVLDRITVYKVKIEGYIAQNQMQLAADIGLYVLKLLEIDLSDADDWTESIRASDLDSRKIEFFRNLPIMSDRSGLAAMEIIATIIPPIYIVKPQLLPIVVNKAIAISLQYGNCSLSAYIYAFQGVLLCGAGKIETGYRLGKLALELQRKFDAREIKSKVDFLFNNMIRHWREPAVSTLEHFLQGIKDGIEVGDIEHACFHSARYCAHLFYVGESLSTANEKLVEQIEFIGSYQQDFQLNYACMWHQLNLNLRGLAPDKLLLIGDSFDETTILDSWLEKNNDMSLFSFYLIKLILCYLFGDYQQAVAYARQGKQYIGASIGLMCFGWYHFYYSLAMLKIYSQDEPEYLSEILSCQAKIRDWSRHAPQNYLHKQELIAAKIAQILGKHEQAEQHYDSAIAAASKAGYQHELAIAEELAGEFYYSQGKIKIAGYYLKDAYQSYRRWGATAKTTQLKSKYGALLNLVDAEWTDNSDRPKDTSGDRPESIDLDLFSIIKASQAISSEIILDNLLSKMMAIVMENAGAQKSFLLLQQNSDWVVAASGLMELSQTINLPYISVDEYDALPSSIFNYVQSTGKTVMLEQASQSGIFVDDPYVVEYQPKSILCCPMRHQNKLQGIIYLENSSIEGAFTTQKLTVLQALLSQVSISIVNARLYKDLEEHTSVQKSLRQKEVLLKEIHHRVKNNLLVVSSLLELQSSYIEDAHVSKLLENCQNRIAAMAMVHQHLYGSSELDKINFAGYIESLLDNLAYSQGSLERNINLILDLEPIELNIESANPCGLIVNELISNAFKHGFGDRQNGNIWVKLKRNLENQIVLTIEDDGVGFGVDRNLQNSGSLGLELVCTLTEQIDGKITLDKSVGTKIEIVFDELNYHSRI